MLQARVNALKDKLSRAYIVDRTNLPDGTVVFGSRVRVKDLDRGEEETFELVGPGDEDYENNKILTNSPIGQGLLGKKKGDTVEITVPRGVERFEILEISFPEG
jgi:transcription elongation factor GreA